MHIAATLLGALAVISVSIDMLNTLVSTRTHAGKWWLTAVLYRRTWRVLRWVCSRLPSDLHREVLLSVFAPISLLLLLAAWVVQQVIGFGLIWWGLGAVGQEASLIDSVYYSGVVYFTLGFGEMVPSSTVPRLGALVEAFSGVLMTAMVIGYLPALYGAYSQREQKLMTLDDGSEGRITPVNLLLSRAPTAEIDDVLRFFEGWEDWTANLIETHSAFPMLRLFRSKHVGQHWITALGVVSDAALLCQLIAGTRNRSPYWMLRRSIILLDGLAASADSSGKWIGRSPQSEGDGFLDDDDLFDQIYEQLQNHGFEMVPLEQGRVETRLLRLRYDARLEFLADDLLAPSGFWGHRIGLAPSVVDRS